MERKKSSMPRNKKSVPVTIFCSGVYKDKEFALGRRRTMDTLPLEDHTARFGPDGAMALEKTHLPIPALTPRVSPRIVPTSQGGVQFPTGGIPFLAGSPRALPGVRKVSRSGERPEPTVTVRMKEKTAAVHGRERFFAAP